MPADISEQELEIWDAPHEAGQGEASRLQRLRLDSFGFPIGFATAQDKYEDAYQALFDSLDWLEERLSEKRYLTGNRLTEADWRLFTTLIRFDAVYYCHFKCNRQQIRDYPNLSGYVRELYQVPGVAETVDIRQIKQHVKEHVRETWAHPCRKVINFHRGGKSTILLQVGWIPVIFARLLRGRQEGTF